MTVNTVLVKNCEWKLRMRELRVGGSWVGGQVSIQTRVLRIYTSYSLEGTDQPTIRCVVLTYISVLSIIIYLDILL